MVVFISKVQEHILGARGGVMSPIKVLEGSRVIRVIIKALSGRQNMVGEVELVGGITRAFGRDLGRQVVTNKVQDTKGELNHSMLQGTDHSRASLLVQGTEGVLSSLVIEE